MRKSQKLQDVHHEVKRFMSQFWQVCKEITAEAQIEIEETGNIQELDFSALKFADFSEQGDY